jgi:DNA modification methylase
MKEERIGPHRLFLGDCMDVMPTLGPVDAVVTDPPWNMDFFEDDKKTWPDYAEWLATLNGHYEAIAPRAAIVFLSSKAIPFVSHVFQGWQPFAACKNFSQMSASRDTIPNAFDIGFARLRGSFTGSGRNWFVCNTAGMLKDRTGHPTPRTVDAMISVIDWIEARTILDPFAGSGTTGVACQKLGRVFIGIEKDPDYFAIMCKRIDEAMRQPDLFIAPPPQPKQEAFL